ncbi:helix-turn-helix domain-containing protein [Ornithinibacillus californiensis]|uniref:helix-turn-helix domain-containing protein n=1 Tax=Ornithinibacillus californiensis TaxID=161536 RepID=UPI00064D8DA6|nr:helix-turn-helix transcriptional regulator [Ornithinibacillus californiensis]
MEKEQLDLITKLFGNELRKYRKVERDVTQERFSEDTGLGPQHISDIEVGKKKLRIETLLRLRHAGVDINDIFDRIIEELKARDIDITLK